MCYVGVYVLCVYVCLLACLGMFVHLHIYVYVCAYCLCECAYVCLHAVRVLRSCVHMSVRVASTPGCGEGVSKIIYASRTHSQLAQVIRELKNTSYRYASYLREGEGGEGGRGKGKEGREGQGRRGGREGEGGREGGREGEGGEGLCVSQCDHLTQHDTTPTGVHMTLHLLVLT